MHSFISALSVAMLVTVPFTPAAAAEDADHAPGVAEIVSQMERHNQLRAQTLQGYRSVRRYRVEYNGFGGHKEAQMAVEATFLAPDRREFQITSESGSKLLLGRVLHRLLQSEKEASNEDNRRQTSLTSDNYEFSLLGRDELPDGPAYILLVIPKRENKFLYRGKIWVDAREYAVARIEAQPAKNPSFWIKQTSIQHRYKRVGDFWLPEHNQSVSGIRFGGKAVLTIEYQEYEVNGKSSEGKAPGSGQMVSGPRLADAGLSA